MRGKRRVGFCKSMPGAVHPYQRVLKRKNLKPTDLVFGKIQRELFNTILEELNEPPRISRRLLRLRMKPR